MFCRTCSQPVADQAMVCMACGCPPRAGTKCCWSCGVETTPGAVMCVKCGVSLAYAGAGWMPGSGTEKVRLTAGLLNLLLPLIGISGIGRIYLGYTAIGVWQLVVGILTCGLGGLWSFIDGIMILSGTPPNDAKGTPFK